MDTLTALTGRQQPRGARGDPGGGRQEISIFRFVLEFINVPRWWGSLLLMVGGILLAGIGGPGGRQQQQQRPTGQAQLSAGCYAHFTPTTPTSAAASGQARLPTGPQSLGSTAPSLPPNSSPKLVTHPTHPYQWGPPPPPAHKRLIPPHPPPPTSQALYLLQTNQTLLLSRAFLLSLLLNKFASWNFPQIETASSHKKLH